MVLLDSYISFLNIKNGLTGNWWQSQCGTQLTDAVYSRPNQATSTRSQWGGYRRRSGTHGIGFPSMQRVPKPGSLVRAFKSSWVPVSSGASLLWVHERWPAQQVIKTINLEQEKFFQNKCLTKYFLWAKLKTEMNKTEPTHKEFRFRPYIWYHVNTQHPKVELCSKLYIWRCVCMCTHTYTQWHTYFNMN